MGRSEFAGVDTHRLDLDGENRWVEVKCEIGVRAQKRIESALLGGVRGAQSLIGRTDITAEDVEMRLDSSAAYLAKLETYIVDWSFCDADGKRVPVSSDAIAALRPDTADEIVEKLNEFLDQQEKERSQNPFSKKDSSKRSA